MTREAAISMVLSAFYIYSRVRVFSRAHAFLFYLFLSFIPFHRNGIPLAPVLRIIYTP